MKVLSSVLKVTLSFLLELFDAKDFELDNSEDKNYKTESFANDTRSQWWLKRLHAEPPLVNEPRISQDHGIKGSCNIVGKSPSREAIILPSLVAIDTLVIEIWWFLFATWPCKTT